MSGFSYDDEGPPTPPFIYIPEREQFRLPFVEWDDLHQQQFFEAQERAQMAAEDNLSQFYRAGWQLEEAEQAEFAAEMDELTSLIEGMSNENIKAEKKKPKKSKKAPLEKKQTGPRPPRPPPPGPFGGMMGIR